jgi:MarR family transcriptional regulator, lower aerobic nicotinate degradation pathway regulator
VPRALDQALGFNLYQVALLFRRELMRALSEHGLTPEQWQILVALDEGGEGLTQNQVAALTLKDKHSVSRILARMERAGWIARRADPCDGRAVRVRPTPRSRRALRPMLATLDGHFRRVDAALTGAERGRLLELLRKLRDELEDERAR